METTKYWRKNSKIKINEKDLMFINWKTIDKMSVFPDFNYRLSAIAVKILAEYFVDIVKPTLMFVWEGKMSNKAIRIMKKKDKEDSHHLISVFNIKL